MMLRRCVLELSSGRSIRLPARRITAQTPFFLSSRSEYSTMSQPNQSQVSATTTGKPSGSGNLLPKLVVGTIVVGAAVGVAYQTGYIGKPHAKDEKPSLQSGKLDVIHDLKVAEHSDDQVVLPSKEPSELSPKIEVGKKNDEPHYLKNMETGRESSSEVIPVEEELAPVKENELPSFSQDITSLPDDQTAGPEISSVDNVEMDNGATNIEDSRKQNEVTNIPIPLPEETAVNESAPHHHTPEEMLKDSLDHEPEAPVSLSEAYSVQRDEDRPEVSLHRESTHTYAPFSIEQEASVLKTVGSEDTNKSEDHKVVLDFLQTIHAAERRQAESDFRIFDEEKRILKEKYEKELRDARARELMYAEEAAMLDKELNKERVKAAATVKLLQEKAEQNLRTELQRKEEETELQLKKFQELAKAELNAAIVKEKSTQMEKIAEANLNINALCMAFYARSEEARQSYSVHKLALGALALEDTLSKGLPIRPEIDALHASLVGIDRDSLLDLVLTSLPEETLNYGTDTQLQLSQKFDALKGTLRHFSLLPPGGGGILAHTVAHIASSIKMREHNQSGDGIESVINRVESFLAEGKLAAAADALEEGVSGTEAEGAAGEWVRQARNRAVTEQALALLQAYANSISLA